MPEKLWVLYEVGFSGLSDAPTEVYWLHEYPESQKGEAVQRLTQLLDCDLCVHMSLADPEEDPSNEPERWIDYQLRSRYGLKPPPLEFRFDRDQIAHGVADAA